MMMNVLIDIGHPAHVHLFKNLAFQMTNEGHSVLFTLREKESEKHLLEVYNLEYRLIGKHNKTRIGKIFGLLFFTLKIIKVAFDFKPDVLISHGSPYLALAGFFLNRPHIALEDTGNIEQVYLYRPFSKVILSPKALKKNFGKKHIKYDSYHEIAYLAPRYFQPDKTVRAKFGFNERDILILVRFVSWQATHDHKQSGFSSEDKIKLVEILERIGKIIISTENSVPELFSRYHHNLPPEKIHDLLYAVDLYIGEGVTMGSESAIIGTPSIIVNSLKPDTIVEQEKYGNIYHFNNSKKLFYDLSSVLNKCLVQMDRVGHEKKFMFNDRLDLTRFLKWLISEYPMSLKTLYSDHEYLNRFIFE
jgi:predicted glycosyltransferase